MASNPGIPPCPSDAALQDQSVFLLGTPDLSWQILCRTLAALPAVRVVGEATSAAAALAAAPPLHPGVIISAPTLAGTSTAAVLATLHARCPASHLVLFGAVVDPPLVQAFAAAGVTGYLLWNLDYATFQQCLATALRGQFFVGSAAPWEAADRQDLSPRSLPDREQRVLALLAAGYTHPQIARRERLGVRTVERIISALAAKLEAPSAFVLGMKAAQLGFVSCR